MLPLPTKALDQHVIVLGKTGSGKSSAIRLIVESLLDRDKPVCIIDPKGDWWGLRSSADGKESGYPVVIFGGDHADYPITPQSGAPVAELVATGNRPAIIDLGGWMPTARTQFFVDFTSTFFRLTRGQRWLAIDEAHNFAPQGKVMDPLSGKALHWANRIASEGRGKGVVLISASQRPQKVHKDYVTSHETLIAKRVIHPLDRKAMQEWIDGYDAATGKQVLESLAQMQRAEAWVWSPEIGFGPKRVAFPLFKTYDSFAPQAADTRKLKGWAAVDAQEISERLAAVIEEEKAKDPAVLRAEIARLTRALTDAQRNTADPQAIEDAHARGYSIGAADMRRQYENAIAILMQQWQEAGPKIERLETELEVLRHFNPDTAGRPAPPQRATMARPAPPAREQLLVRKQQAIHDANAIAAQADDKLPKAERLILTALAQYREGRTKKQIAILTGYAINGGGFNNALGALRNANRIEGTGHMRITQDGINALGSFAPLPHGRALMDYWLAQLPKAEREALSAIAAVYPSSLPKESVAKAAGYQPNGGGFNNALGRLRSLELIEGRGDLRASDALFG